MSKCDFNKVALRLYWKHTSAWVFSCKFPAYIQNTFSQEHLWVAVSEMLNFIKFDKRVSFQKSFFQKIVLFKKFLLKIGFSSRKEFRNFVETRNYWLMKKEGHIILCTLWKRFFERFALIIGKHLRWCLLLKSNAGVFLWI